MRKVKFQISIWASALLCEVSHDFSHSFKAILKVTAAYFLTLSFYRKLFVKTCHVDALRYVKNVHNLSHIFET